MLNSRGQCCGRKPLVYKLDGYRFCPRCDREYEIGADTQRVNWAWEKDSTGTFVRTALGNRSSSETVSPEHG